MLFNDVLIKRFQEIDKNPPKNTIKQTLFRVIPSDNHLIIQLECTGKGGGDVPAIKVTMKSTRSHEPSPHERRR